MDRTDMVEGRDFVDHAEAAPDDGRAESARPVILHLLPESGHDNPNQEGGLTISETLFASDTAMTYIAPAQKR